MIMFLPVFTSTQLQKEAKKVFSKVDEGPIEVYRSRNNVQGYVMLTKKDYVKLLEAGK